MLVRNKKTGLERRVTEAEWDKLKNHSVLSKVYVLVSKDTIPDELLGTDIDIDLEDIEAIKEELTKREIPFDGRSGIEKLRKLLVESTPAE